MQEGEGGPVAQGCGSRVTRASLQSGGLAQVSELSVGVRELEDKGAMEGCGLPARGQGPSRSEGAPTEGPGMGNQPPG